MAAASGTGCSTTVSAGVMRATCQSAGAQYSGDNKPGKNFSQEDKRVAVEMHRAKVPFTQIRQQLGMTIGHCPRPR